MYKLKTFNEEFIRLFDELIEDNIAFIEPLLARDIGRMSIIKELRNNDLIFIAHDRKKHKTLIHLDKNVRIRRERNDFFFEL